MTKYGVYVENQWSRTFDGLKEAMIDAKSLCFAAKLAEVAVTIEIRDRDTDWVEMRWRVR